MSISCDIEENICIFCLVDMAGAENTNVFGCQCNVSYHETCINSWIKYRGKVCPICKKGSEEVISQRRLLYTRIREEMRTIMILFLLYAILIFVGGIAYAIRFI